VGEELLSVMEAKTAEVFVKENVQVLIGMDLPCFASLLHLHERARGSQVVASGLKQERSAFSRQVVALTAALATSGCLHHF
jgi:hypothetical protein